MTKPSLTEAQMNHPAVVAYLAAQHARGIGDARDGAANLIAGRVSPEVITNVKTRVLAVAMIAAFRHLHATDLTSKETAVLMAIRDSEYREGGLDQPVWTMGLSERAGLTARSMGGVFASLSDKGLVSLAGRGKEATVVLLAPAIAFLGSLA